MVLVLLLRSQLHALLLRLLRCCNALLYLQDTVAVCLISFQPWFCAHSFIP